MALRQDELEALLQEGLALGGSSSGDDELEALLQEGLSLNPPGEQEPRDPEPGMSAATPGEAVSTVAGLIPGLIQRYALGDEIRTPPPDPELGDVRGYQGEITGTMRSDEPTGVDWLADRVESGLQRGRQMFATGLREAGVAYDDDSKYATRMADLQRGVEANALSLEDEERMRRMKQEGDKGLLAAIGQAATNPDLMMGVVAESLGMYAPGLAMTMAGSLAGPMGTASAAGISSAVVEYTNTLIDEMTASGLDPTDPETWRRAVQDEDLMSRARVRGAKRGLPIGVFDGLTAGVAGRLLRGANTTFRSQAARTAGELGIQAGGGAAGEATAGLLTDDFSWFDTVTEAVAELPTGAVEIPGNLAAARREAIKNDPQAQLGLAMQEDVANTLVNPAAVDQRVRASLDPGFPIPRAPKTGDPTVDQFLESAALQSIGLQQLQENASLSAALAAMPTGGSEENPYAPKAPKVDLPTVSGPGPFFTIAGEGKGSELDQLLQLKQQLLDNYGRMTLEEKAQADQQLAQIAELEQRVRDDARVDIDQRAMYEGQTPSDLAGGLVGRAAGMREQLEQRRGAAEVRAVSDQAPANPAMAEALTAAGVRRPEPPAEPNPVDGTGPMFSPRQDEPEARAEPAQTFVTRTEQLINERMGNKDVAAALANKVRAWGRKGEIKPEEMEYVDLAGWLESRGKDRVTKDEVLAKVRELQPQLGEVRRQAAENNNDMLWVRERWVDQQEQAHSIRYVDSLDGYTIEDPDGEQTDFNTYASEASARAALRDRLFWQAEDANDGDLAADLGDAIQPTKYDNYTQPGGKDYEELLITNDGKVERPYQSSHWDTDNVLAHVRHKTRTNQAGEKVLHVEEIQSDWHQQGRKRGYAQRSTPRERPIVAEIVESDPRVTGFRYEGRDGDGNVLGWADTPEQIQENVDRSFREELVRERFDERGTIPDAPFKKSWPMLAMKRMIRHAAENGFDRIAWSTGAMNADLYNLRKQVGYIEYSPTGPNDFYVRVIGVDGGIIDVRYKQTPDQIEEFVGKEIAERMVKKEGTYEGTDDDGVDVYLLEGDDLEVGGEGMSAFYDKILPNEIKKYAKRYGVEIEPTRVTREGEAAINLTGDEPIADDYPSFRMTDELRQAAMEGQPMFNPRQGDDAAAEGAEPEAEPPEPEATNPSSSGRKMEVPFINVPANFRGRIEPRNQLPVGIPANEADRAEVRRKLDRLARRFPNPLSSTQVWNRFVAEATGNTESGIIPPLRAMNWSKDPQGLITFLSDMTPGQQRSADEGLALAAELGEMFSDGVLDATDFAMVMVWAGLSRQLTASVHEAGFLRALNNNIRPFVEKAVLGQFTNADTQAGLQWVEANYPKGGGMPTGAKANLNTTFETTLPALSAARVDGVPLIERVYEQLADPRVPTSEIRRTFLLNAGSSGLQTKVFSFALLVSGRLDAIVVDRWQVRNFWGDNPAIENAEPVTVIKATKSGELKENTIPLADALYDKVPVGRVNAKGETPVSGMQAYLDGPLGMAIYEGLERGLAAAATEAYGRPETGRLHWETWLVINQQEVGHASLDAIKTRTAEGARVKEGRQIISENDIFAVEGGQEVYYVPDELGNYARFTKDEYAQLPNQTDQRSQRRGAVAAKLAAARRERAVADGDDADRARAQERAYLRDNAVTGVRRQLREELGRWRDQGSDNERLPGPYRRRGRTFARRTLGGEKVNAQSLGAIKGIADTFALGGISQPDIFELETTGKDKHRRESAALFHKSISEAKAANPYGAAVYVYDQADYEGMQLFLTEDRKAGFALKGNDIVSVFNTPGSNHKAVTTALILAAVQNGGRKLDAFDTVLPRLYSAAKMRVVARIPWNDQEARENMPDWDKGTFAAFNGGEPDVVFMVYSPQREDAYTPGEGQRVDSYDEAVELQEAAIVDDLMYSPRQSATPELVNGGVLDEREANEALRRLEEKMGFAEGTLESIAVPDALDARTLATLADLLGRNIVTFRNTSDKTFNGVVDPSQPDVIFIDIASDSPAMAVLGHEFIHTLARTQPELFLKYANAVLRAAGVTEGQIREYSDWVNSRRPDGNKIPRIKVLEEMVADLAGDSFNSPEFWDNLRQRKPDIFKDLVLAFKQFIDRMLAGFSKADTQLRGSRYVKDMEAVRDVVADMLDQYVTDRQTRLQPTVDALVAQTEQSVAAEAEGLYSGYEPETNQVREPRRAARKRRTADLDAPANVPDAAAQAVDNFLLGYKSVPIGEVRSGVERVTTPEEAAHVLAPFRKYGQEHMAVLVLDGQGKPTQIIQHAVGGVAESQVFPGTLAGAIASDPKAASVWIAHNHPGGNPEPSGPDLRITKTITDTLDGSGIAVNGHVVLAAANGEAYHIDQHGGAQGPVRIKPLVRKRTVPITERKIRKNPPKERQQVTSPDVARAMLDQVTSDNAVILLDNQHNMVGSLTLTAEEMTALRQGGTVRRLLSGIDKTNAAAAIIKASGPDRASNVAKFLNQGKKVRVLDAMIKDSTGGYTSSAERGWGTEGETGMFYSPRQQQTPGFDAPDELDWFDQVKIKLVDKYEGLAKIQKAIGQVDEDKDAMLAIVGYPGRVRARLDDFERDVIEPLKEAITASGLEFEEIGKYMHARHAAEANRVLKERDRRGRDNLSGMSDTEASRVLNQYRGNREMMGIARRLDEISKARLDLMQDEGLMSQEERDSWESLYQHYAPLHREEGFSLLPTRGQGFNVRGKRESKLRVGSQTRKVDHANMVGRILMQYEFAVQRAEKNRVAQTLYRLAEDNPNSDLWMVDEVPKRPFLDRQGKVDYIDNFMDENVMAAKFDGKVKYLTFESDNEVAAQLARALKNVDGKSSAILVPLLMANRALAAVNTSLSPEFVISNFFRDWQTAGYNLTDTEIDGMQRQVLGGTPSAIKGIRNALRGDGSNQWAPWFERFRKAGGMTGWMQSYDSVLSRQRTLQWDMKTDKPGLKQIKKVFKGIEDYNTIIENGVRLAAFKAAVEAGLSDAQAARIAKELTVNFNRRGEWGVAANALYLFYNASMQGSVRLLRAALNPKNKRLHKMMAGTVVFAAAVEMLNHLMDDDDEYKLIDDSVKDRNLVIMDPFDLTEDGYFKIPLPWGYNVLHVVGQELGRAAMHQAGMLKDYSRLGSVGRVGVNLLQSFNPIQDGSFLQTVSPTFLDPATRVGENKDWHGGKLFPDYNPNQADHKKHFANVRAESKEIASWLAEVTRDEQTLRSSIDVSPETLDMLYDFATGSLGRVIADGAGLVKAAMGAAPAPELKRWPLVRKVYQEIGDSDKERYFYDRFYTMIETIQAVQDTPAQERGKTMQQLGPRRRLIGPTKTLRTELRKISSQLKLARDRKQEGRIERLKARRVRLMERWLEQYERVVYGE